MEILHEAARSGEEAYAAGKPSSPDLDWWNKTADEAGHPRGFSTPMWNDIRRWFRDGWEAAKSEAEHYESPGDGEGAR